MLTSSFSGDLLPRPSVASFDTTALFDQPSVSLNYFITRIGNTLCSSNFRNRSTDVLLLTRTARSFIVRSDASSYEKITHDEFSDTAWQAIVSSPEVAKENKHQTVETEHLMKALLEQQNGVVTRIFSKTGVDITRLLEATDDYIQRQSKPKHVFSWSHYDVLRQVIGESPTLGQDLEALMERARDYKKEYGDSFVFVEHFVLGFVQDNRFGKQLFKDFQISLKTLKKAIESIREDPEGKYESLEKYAKDLTAMARAGKLDPMIGRDDEIHRCIHILSRITKNNPVLIGEPDVGKTAISEGLGKLLKIHQC